VQRLRRKLRNRRRQGPRAVRKVSVPKGRGSSGAKTARLVRSAALVRPGASVVKVAVASVLIGRPVVVQAEIEAIEGHAVTVPAAAGPSKWLRISNSKS
jgi:hypothetical protein